MTIRLLLLDVDGVMTDGTKTYNEEHEVISKKYCDLDFTAIRRFMASDVPVVLVSGDRFNTGMANKRSIPIIISRDKIKELPSIMKKFGTSYDDTAFVGDDLFDKGIMEGCKYRFCPSNSPRTLKMICTDVINRHGGDGAIAELYDMCVGKKLITPASLVDIQDWHS